MTDYRDDRDHDATMPPPNNAGADKRNLPDHPLLAAFKDMARMAVTNKGLKVLARIEHGIANRTKWIEARQAQIERLRLLSVEVLHAYDAGDDKQMRAIMGEVEQIVAMTEGVSPTEMRIGEVIDEAEEVAEGFPDPERLPFKRGRRG